MDGYPYCADAARADAEVPGLAIILETFSTSLYSRPHPFCDSLLLRLLLPAILAFLKCPWEMR